MTVIGRPPILRPILSSANSAASRMSPPAALSGPVNVPRKPILMSCLLSCAAAGPFSATTMAIPARAIRISSSRLFAAAFDGTLVPEHLGREIRALAHGLELLPDHGVVNLGSVQRLR